MMLHPYYGEPDDSPSGPYSRKPFVWDKVATRPNAGGAWIPMPPFDETAADGTLKFLPSKYRTAKYSTRQLMGWDSAVKRANEDGDPIKWVVLCEGPLDAARVGPGGVALIGSSISVDNAEKVASNFHIVFTAFDEDKAGKGATDKVGKMLLGSKCRAPLVQLVIPLPIPSGKDIGDMRQEVFDDMLSKSIKRSKRGV
jgi:DNA primase